jgi:6-phosphogluconolactonase
MLNKIDFDLEDDYFDSISLKIIKTIQIEITKKNFCSIVLSGGNTPLKIYPYLLKYKIDWKKIYFFWSDDRYVNYDNPLSNYGNTKTYFLDHIDYKHENVFNFSFLPSIQESKSFFELKLNNFLSEIQNSFDISILGMGTDGHTASIFNTNDLNENVLITSKENEKFKRISLGIKTLNFSRTIILLTNDEKLKIYNSLESYPVNFLNRKKTLIYNLKQ